MPIKKDPMKHHQLYIEVIFSLLLPPKKHLTLFTHITEYWRKENVKIVRRLLDTQYLGTQITIMGPLLEQGSLRVGLVINGSGLIVPEPFRSLLSK